MKNPTPTPTTRASLIATASQSSRWLTGFVAGSAMLGSAVLAADWAGTTSSSWNEPTNWNPTGVPAAPTIANINVATTNYPVLVSNAIADPQIVNVGVGSGVSGRLDIGNNGRLSVVNRVLIGENSVSGVLNIADTSVTVNDPAKFTPYGQSGGDGLKLQVGERLYIGGVDGGAAAGVANVNTTGSIQVSGHIVVGDGSGTGGTLNMDSGTITTTGGELWVGQAANSVGRLNMSNGTINVSNNWVAIGRNGATGYVTMTGGTINKAGSGDFIIGTDPGGNATFEMKAGTVNVTSGVVGVGDRNNTGAAPGTQGGTPLGILRFPAGSTATFTANGGNFIVGRHRSTVGGHGLLELQSADATVTCVGTRQFFVGNGAAAKGVVNLTLGTINVNDWIAVGREGATGELNMTGGKIVKTGGGSIAVGAGLTNSRGTINQSGGLIDVQSGSFLLAEAGITPEGTLNLSGTGEIKVGTFGVGVVGGGTGNANLDGGTLRTQVIDGGAGIANVDFNGTQIVATGGHGDFINEIDTARVEGGGLRIDTNGFTLSTAQQLQNAGGGVVKSGAGVLNLTGLNGYAGPSTVEAGTLNITTASNGGGAYTVNSGATLGVTQLTGSSVLPVSNLTMNNGSTLNISMANAPFNPDAAVVNVTGTLSTSGTVTINLTDITPATGTLRLISYAAGSGANFVLGSIPDGVVATLSDSLGLVSLNVTRVRAPHWTGDNGAGGDNTAAWNTTDLFWTDSYSGTPTNFANGDPAFFEDLTVTPTEYNVTLDVPVTVGGSGVTFDNDLVPFTLTGSGKISGTKGLTKRGDDELTIGNLLNDFTGPAVLVEGITNVGLLANAGSPSPLGAGNTVLAGGTLNYTGESVTIDRGIQVAAAANNLTSRISVATGATNLTISGPVTATQGSLLKTGPGTLTLTNPGANILGNGATPAAGVNEGTLVLSGGGTQTNQVSGGDFWLGSSGTTGAGILMNGATLSGSGWFTMSRGNGSTGLVSTLNATNSAITFTNVSLGYDNAFPGYNTTSNVTLTDSSFSVGTGTIYFGESNGSTAVVTLNGTSSIASGAFQLGRHGGSSGTLHQNGGTVNIGEPVDGVRIGGSGAGIWNLNAGVVNASGWNVIGRFAGSNGQLNVSGGTFNQSQPDRAMIVAELGSGTVTVSGSGALNCTADGGLFVTNGSGSTGIINLDGGSLTTKRIREGAGNVGTATFNFNGGNLIAATGAEPVLFMEGLNFAYVKSGGANINTNNQNIAIAQPLLTDTNSPGGGLSKSGAGILRLNGVNTYTGTTTVTTGSLGGTGTIAGPVEVQNGAALAPGAATGTLTASGGVTFNPGAIFMANIDDSQAIDNGRLDTTGTLNLTGVHLQVNVVGTAAAGPYTIATAGSVSGEFASKPSNVDVTYTSTSIIITPSAETPFESWIDDFNVGGLDQPGDDADKDGMTNREEFALDGDPSNGAATGKVRSRIETVGADQALVITLPVRVGANFDNNPGPGLDATITADDLVYLIKGSNNLSNFDQIVTEVSPASAANMPSLSDGTKWTYRTFRLSGAIPARGAKGFLRVTIEDAP